MLLLILLDFLHIMSFANKDSFISLFPICIIFLLFFCFIALAKTASTVLKRSDERGHPYLVPNLGGEASSFLSLSIMLVVGILVLIINWWKFASIPKNLLRNLLRGFFFFIMNQCWILIKSFSASTDMIVQFLFFNLLM